jgi:hypothetical protein
VGVALSLDRFEGREKEIAVLVTPDGGAVSMPRTLLPAGARPGCVITLSLVVDEAATQALAAQTRAVQADLARTDPGGDISL